jgi:hypothetical protein
MAANKEIKRIVGKIKTVQQQFQGLVKDKTWLEDARKYAETQGKEIKKLVKGDMNKVKSFLDRERKQLERFQKQIPGEIKKFKEFVNDQKKELEQLLATVKKSSGKGRKPAGKKKASSRARAKDSGATVATAAPNPSPSAAPMGDSISTPSDSN